MIDLRSDTVTRPSIAMRKAMADAEVGDDVFGEDPTVNRLQQYAAELFGKEAALFLPTGTMANLCAFLAQTRPGDTIIMSEGAHPFHYENANVAMVGGLLVRTISDPLGKFTADQVRDKVVFIDDPHFSFTRLVSVENTTNRGGGACWETGEIERITAVCRQFDMRLHCDGARIFNACVATKTEPQQYGQYCDSICFCLSKGLGAPAGSLLLSDRFTIKQALRFRKMVGGGMRQAGILAAAGLYALQHHIPDLEEDHRRAAIFRQALENEGASFVFPSPTNILYMYVKDPLRAVGDLAQAGVLVLPHEPSQIRVVFHRDIDDQMLSKAIEIFKQKLSSL